MSTNVQVNPLLLIAFPEDTNVGFIPNIPDQTLQRMVGLEVLHQGPHKQVIIRPVAPITGPNRGRICIIGPPDIVWEQDKVGTVLAAGAVV